MKNQPDKSRQSQILNDSAVWRLAVCFESSQTQQIVIRLSRDETINSFEADAARQSKLIDLFKSFSVHEEIIRR